MQGPKQASSPRTGAPASIGSRIDVGKVSKSYGDGGFRQGGRARLQLHPRSRQADGDDRPLRVRQEHADPPAGRLRAPDQRHHRHRRQAGDRSRRRPAGGVPGDRAVSLDDRPTTTSCTARARATRTRREMREFAEFLLEKVGLARFPQEISVPAFGRHAAARRACALHDQQAECHDPGRAVSRPRRDDEAADAGILRQSLRRIPPHDVFRHHRHRRGHLPGRPAS